MSLLLKTVKILVGLALVPACWGAVPAAWDFFRESFGASLPFWIGVLTYLLLLAIFQQPIRTYVFGHELTHAVWVYLCGGRVEGFRSGVRGGKVRATRANALIFLAPYLFPVYSILVVIAWVILGSFVTPPPGREIFSGLLGFSWAFHLTFTIFFLVQGQPDLAAAGRIFSLPLLWLGNLAVLVLLVALATEATPPDPARTFLEGIAGAYRELWGMIR